MRVTEWPAFGLVDDPQIALSRPIDLDDAAGLAMLEDALARDQPTLAPHLLTYRRLFFSSPPWRAVTPTGDVELAPGTRYPQPIPLGYLLRLCAYLADLEACAGFAALVHGLTNPQQFRSSAFEVQAAHWCLTRPGTHDVALAPRREDTQRRFDFTWSFRGELVHCECKRADIFENAVVGRLERLADIVDDVYRESGGWSDDLRLDVQVKAMPSAFRQRLTEIVQQVNAAAVPIDGLCLESPGLTLTARRRRERTDVPATSWRVIGCAVPPGMQRTLDDPREAHYTVEFDVRRYLTRATRELMRQARSQLPHEVDAGIFLLLSGSPVLTEVERLLALPSFSNVTFTALWGRDHPLAAVYRQGGAFDGDLLRSRPVGKPPASCARATVSRDVLT